MIISTNCKDIAVSVLKKGSKVSLSLVKIEKERNQTKNILIKADSLFPFSVPLVTENSLRFFEFLVEAKNFSNRYLRDRFKLEKLYK